MDRAGPFTIAQAAAAGVRWEQLQSRAYRRLPCGIYVSAMVPDTPLLHLRAARLRLPDSAVFSGLTAAWLHGLTDPPARIEATVPRDTGMSSLTGVNIRRTRFTKLDVVRRQGLPTTSVLRTLVDISRTRSLVHAVVIADTALNRGEIGLETMSAAVPERGAGKWRRVLEHAEPLAESPMESELRMLLVLAGLPRPQAQAELRDADGRFLARVDLYYASHRLAIEYDGGTHRDSLVGDNRRQNHVLAAGYAIRRFTAPDVRGRPASVVAQIRSDLASAAAA